MKRIVSILAALALAVSVMTGVSAAETANATSGGLMQMSDSEKEAFINENLDVRLRRLSTLVTLSANRLYDEIADEVEAALGDGLTAVEIKEALYHSAAYCGYTRAALALDAAENGAPFDLLYIDLEDSLSALGEVIGLTVQEEIIDQVFSRFCVGK